MEADAERLAPPAALCVVTDRHRVSRPLTSAVADAVAGGASWIRVREPDLELLAYVTLCQLLIDAVSDDRVTWTVRPDAYLFLRSAWPTLRVGVHLTGTHMIWDAPDHRVLVGHSLHAADVAAASTRDDLHRRLVDYALFAPIYSTTSKPNVAPAGTHALARAVQRANCPVFALGGVTPATIAACVAAGAFGVAVSSGILAADAPREASDAYLQALRHAHSP